MACSPNFPRPIRVLSERGRILQAHFPPGITGPVTILVQNRSADFRTDAELKDNQPGWQQIETFSETLKEKKNDLGIDDVRSVAYPLGMAERVQTNRLQMRALRKRAQSHYVSDKQGYEGQVTRVDVVLGYDPFSPQSMVGLRPIEGDSRSTVP